ncbi:MAG: Rrf2 family transcriptional regulator [Candidatus Eisenbacteria bacterium]|uniref:Rrf2 family transcriptional regulator n=1 Tax=Eiseniibacteriota bacterium TaxID=2212470 RepID=A0A938BMT1_UNCEI|nr:Rrf2 family transcriptional regulator [Candidatus Eisenbacteria bacterium]
MPIHVTTKGCYGLRAMIELALPREEETLSVLELSRRLAVSGKYLHALLGALKNGGLVRSRQGCRGGYRLARKPGDIRLGEILYALEGPLRLRECVADGDACARSRDCVTRLLWAELGREIEASLDRLTLAGIARRARRTCRESAPPPRARVAVVRPGGGPRPGPGDRRR